MHRITKFEGSFSKVGKLRYRLLIWLAGFVFRREDRFLYFLKSVGMSDSFCVLALERNYRLGNRDAMILLANLIANPFSEPKETDSEA